MRKWQDQFATEGSQTFAAKSQPTALEEENCCLQAEVDRLRMDRKSEGLLRDLEKGLGTSRSTIGDEPTKSPLLIAECLG